MSVRYDDKGKFFTDRVTKDEVPAIIQTQVSKIQGNLHVRIEDRVKDELNGDEKFLALTDAIIFNLQGEKIYDAEFILINRDHVIWVVPDEENTKIGLQSEDEG